LQKSGNKNSETKVTKIQNKNYTNPETKVESGNKNQIRKNMKRIKRKGKKKENQKIKE
jgi:hypothetical protein